MKKKKLKFTGTVPYVPTDAPDPWGLTIGTLQGEITLASSLSRPADRLALHVANVTVIASLHWVYKKRWNPSHKIPLSAKTFEVWGDYFHALLSLCIELHAMHPLGQQYVNAGEWFLCICREFRWGGLTAAQVKHSKRTDLEKLRDHIQKLRDFVNPIDDENEHHTWSLYEAAIQLQQTGKFPKAIRGLWTGSIKVGRFENKGLVAASTALCNHLEKDTSLAAFWASDSGIVAQSGRGKDLTGIGNPLIEAFLSGSKTFN